MNIVRIATFLLVTALVPLSGLAAEKVEGILICATTHTVECEGSGGECHQGGGDDINFPQFFRVDFKERKMHVLDPGRKGETTDVTHLARSESRGRVILQGVEDGRPWSMMITEQTGRFSLDTTCAPSTLA